MAGAAASEMVLFIGALGAAAMVAAGLFVATGHYTSGLRDRSVALEAEMTGRIMVVNDPVAVPTDPLVLYVKNTGSRELTIASFVVLVDGQVALNWTATVDGEPRSTLRPGQLAALEVQDLELAPGDHRALVMAGPGHSDVLEFVV